MRQVAVGIAWLLLLGSAESAARGRPSELSGKAAVRLIRTTLKAGKKLKLLDKLPDADELEYTSISARHNGGVLLIKRSSSGSGVDAGWSLTEWRVDVKRCSATGLSSSGNDGQYTAGFHYRTDGRAGAASTSELVEFASAFDRELAEPDRARHGAARLWVEERCLDRDLPKSGWSLTPVLKPTQAWRAGPPVGSESTLWSVAQLKPLGVKPPPIEPDEDGADHPADGVLAMAQEAPVLKRSEGRYRIYESALRGRNRGAAVAIFDSAKKQHCWAVETRDCLSGAIRWLGGDGEILLGIATPTHPVYFRERGVSLFLLHLPTCRAFHLLVAGQESPPPSGDVDVDSEEDAVPVVASLKGSVVQVQPKGGKKVRIPIAELKKKLGAR